MHLTNPRLPLFEESCDPDRYLDEPTPPPDRFVEPNTEGRLISELRTQVTRAIADPLAALVGAVIAQLQEDTVLAHALADLTVTGRRAYAAFRAAQPTDDALTDRVLLAHDVEEARVREAVAAVLDRAYTVAWALVSGDVPDDLEWFAISGEDDTAHRALNVPPLDQLQLDIVVPVLASGVAAGRTVTSRFILWDRDNRVVPVDSADAIADRTLPVPAVPRFDPERRYLLYLHGLGSSAEEPLRLAEALGGGSVGVLSVDLPDSGCAALFDHLEIADTAPYFGSHDDFPLLEFDTQFVVDFVQQVEVSFGFRLRDHIAGVAGGSLGGNLVLRLLARDRDQIPWLATYFAWSAASVWSPVGGLSMIGYNAVWSNGNTEETPQTRAGDIARDYDDTSLTFTIASTWYCACYEPCKTSLLDFSRQLLRQSYHPMRRRWNRRLAAEQLKASHSVPHTRVELLSGRLLLLAGDNDNYMYARIYDWTGTLAMRAIGVHGELARLSSTGHSIHEERPVELASLIRQFLPAPPPEDGASAEWGSWDALGGDPSSRPTFVRHASGQLEIIVTNGDLDMHSVRQLGANGRWDNDWTPLASGLSDTTVFGGEVAVAPYADGSLHLFCATDPPGSIAHTVQTTPDGAWDGPWSAGNATQTLLGRAEDSAFALTRWAEGNEVLSDMRVILAGCLTTSGLVHVRGRNRQGNWWTSGKNVADPNRALQGVPFAINAVTGKTFILARGTDDRVYSAGLVGDDDWDTEWTRVPGGRVTSDVTAVLDVAGDVYVVARGDDGDLLLTHNDGDDDAWTSWVTIAAEIRAGTRPVIVRNPWGEVQVFATWSDGTVRTLRQRLGIVRQWTGWHDLGGDTDLAPAVAANANGMLVVAITGRDGEVHVRATRFDRTVVFTSAMRADGRLTDLVTVDGRVMPVNTVIADILAERVQYLIAVPGAGQARLIVRQYLATWPDDLIENNLGELPTLGFDEVTLVDPPVSLVDRYVTHLVVGSDRRFGSKRLHNDSEGWSVGERTAFEQILRGTHGYTIHDGNELVARQYLSTLPDGRPDNNLGELPSYDG